MLVMFVNFSFVLGLLMAFASLISFHYSITPLIHGLKLGIVNEEVQNCNENFNRSKISCTFLEHLSDDEIIETKFYAILDEAFEDLKSGKVAGLVHFTKIFSESFRLTSNEAFYTTPASGEINVHFNGLNFNEIVFLKIRIMKVYHKFNAEISRDFNVSSKLLKVPIEIEMIIKTPETGFYETISMAIAPL